MPIPDFQSLMLPALKALAGGKGAPISEVREHIAAAELLTVNDMQEWSSICSSPWGTAAAIPRWGV